MISERYAEILWSPQGRGVLPQGRGIDGVITLIDEGRCEYCNELFIKCQGCGMTINFVGKEFPECMCEIVYKREFENIGSGLTEEVVYIVSTSGEKPEFIDPNQLKLFKED